MKQTIRIGWLSVVSVLLLVCAGEYAGAWWEEGHAAVVEAAFDVLPERMPPPFRRARKEVAELSAEPDIWADRQTPRLRATERSEHYINLEYLGDRELPPTRYQAIRLYADLGYKAEEVGLLPYAIIEWQQRLTSAFRDYRLRPTKAVEYKCVVYAGVLAHYAADACQPLHVTKHHDGRDGRQQGIHGKIDAFPGAAHLTREELGKDVAPSFLRDPWQETLAVIRESHQHVGRCYELDGTGGFDRQSPDARLFALERCRRAVQFTASLWLTAWQTSSRMEPPRARRRELSTDHAETSRH